MRCARLRQTWCKPGEQADRSSHPRGWRTNRRTGKVLHFRSNLQLGWLARNVVVDLCPIK